MSIRGAGLVDVPAVVRLLVPTDRPTPGPPAGPEPAPGAVDRAQRRIRTQRALRLLLAHYTLEEGQVWVAEREYEGLAAAAIWLPPGAQPAGARLTGPLHRELQHPSTSSPRASGPAPRSTPHGPGSGTGRSSPSASSTAAIRTWRHGCWGRASPRWTPSPRRRSRSRPPGARRAAAALRLPGPARGAARPGAGAWLSYRPLGGGAAEEPAADADRADPPEGPAHDGSAPALGGSVAGSVAERGGAGWRRPGRGTAVADRSTPVRRARAESRSGKPLGSVFKGAAGRERRLVRWIARRRAALVPGRTRATPTTRRGAVPGVGSRPPLEDGP
ncbi:hypothetical protein NKH77_03445 [Streptomyces sp. M19]